MKIETRLMAIPNLTWRRKDKYHERFIFDRYGIAKTKPRIPETKKVTNKTIFQKRRWDKRVIFLNFTSKIEIIYKIINTSRIGIV